MKRRKILITTRTYSAAYPETQSLCIGILLDDFETPLHWIQLSLLNRHSNFYQRCPYWSIISAEIAENPAHSTESYFLKDDSIQIIRQLGTARNWLERKSYLFPLKLRCIADIQTQNSSIGIIKPQSISGYFCLYNPNELGAPDSNPSVESERILYQFGYQFIDGVGTSYQCPISNWEMIELYKNYRDASTESSLPAREQEALAKTMEKLEEFINEKDLYFILSLADKPTKRFSIVGLFHPPLIHFEQMSLF